MNPPNSPAAPPGSDALPTRASLLARLKDLGDQQSWADFYDIYRGLILRCARDAGLPEPDAEDLMQETVIAVARRMPSFRYDPLDCSFKTWLRLVVRARIADYYRRRGRRPAPAACVSTGDDTGTGLLDQIPDPASLEPDAVWEEEWRKILLAEAHRRARAKVNPKHWQIYDYHVVQGHSAEETAGHLGLNRAAVYMARLRVGRLVKQELAREAAATDAPTLRDPASE